MLIYVWKRLYRPLPCKDIHLVQSIHWRNYRWRLLGRFGFRSLLLRQNRGGPWTLSLDAGWFAHRHISGRSMNKFLFVWELWHLPYCARLHIWYRDERMWHIKRQFQITALVVKMKTSIQNSFNFPGIWGDCFQLPGLWRRLREHVVPIRRLLAHHARYRHNRHCSAGWEEMFKGFVKIIVYY